MKPNSVFYGSVWPFLLTIFLIVLLLLISPLFEVKPAAAVGVDGEDDANFGTGFFEELDRSESDLQNSIQLAGIIVEKEADPTVVHYGNQVTYSFRVSNIAGEPVTDLQVTDNKCSPVTFQGGDTNSNNRLDVDESWIYECTKSLTANTLNLVS
ncbi:MAG: hypothetical protein JXA42_03430, partial [Anaerolineales bacterium]|nr:hypothetical protein [Anaerolineales bacterium]